MALWQGPGMHLISAQLEVRRVHLLGAGGGEANRNAARRGLLQHGRHAGPCGQALLKLGGDAIGLTEPRVRFLFDLAYIKQVRVAITRSNCTSRTTFVQCLLGPIPWPSTLKAHKGNCRCLWWCRWRRGIPTCRWDMGLRWIKGGMQHLCMVMHCKWWLKEFTGLG